MSNPEPKHLPIMKSAYIVVAKGLEYDGMFYGGTAELQLTDAEAAPFIANGSVKLLGAS
jgi:hypothetical protein